MSTSSYRLDISSLIMPEVYAPPTGPPPTNQTTRPQRQGSQDLEIPDEPPPAYTSVASSAHEQTIEAGPSRMDFSGPPPLPDRLQANITGVGIGYEPRVHRVSSQYTGQSGNRNPFADSSSRPDLPHNGSFNPPSDPPPGRPSFSSHTSNTGGGSHGGYSGQGGSSHNVDTSPTEVPTPGRPLLRNGQMLVYPKGHYCHKCRFMRYPFILS